MIGEPNTILNIGGIEFKNPVITASGTFGFGEEYSKFYTPNILGGICTKGLTLTKREGNTGLRVYETPLGMMNSVGLQNPGIDAFINEILPAMDRFDTVKIANVGGSQIDDYIQSVEKLNETTIDMIELNISCPNVKEGGVAFGIKTESAKQIVREIRRVCKKPLMVKLSPDAESIRDIAYMCEQEGADAVSLINTFRALAIDIENRRPYFDNVYAGLSGPAIKNIALRMVHEVYKTVKIPVVGMGGIFTPSDAIEFIMAGAAAIQIGTASFAKPTAGAEIVEGIKTYMVENVIQSLSEIRGII